MSLSESYILGFKHFIPESIAVITMVVLLLLASMKNIKKVSYALAGIGMLAALATLCCNLSLPPIHIFSSSLIIDSFGTIMKIVMVLGTLGAIYLSYNSSDIYSELKIEFVIMVIGVLIGGMLLASASNLLTLYIGIETLSILSYALASFKRNDERSSEAGLKYVLYGGLTAGIMLFGMSHVFGILGTIQFTEMVSVIPELTNSQIAVLIPSFLLFLVGIGYKIACVPFHMWAPDVYEGSPIPVTTFFAIVPKIAGVSVLLRISLTLFSSAGALQFSWVAVLTVIAALTMTVGNIAAINQKSVKRMLAYSSISHAGVMLLGILVVNKTGTASVVFYSITYLFMTLAAFYITSIVSDKYGNDHFERFNGLLSRYPLMAIVMIVTMFSLAGLPPLSGFVAKFNIISAVIDSKFYTLGVIAVLNSVISLFYYLKIVRHMVFCPTESTEKIDGFALSSQVIIGIIVIPIILLGIFWSDLHTLSTSASLFVSL
ncbi:MAG: NADH-quinone oxidoreductase subunit N [Bdellovibrionales bacterium]|nr:NADH-quinone oxidoreductase subunit N [Bdellovibrionales bacterium]